MFFRILTFLLLAFAIPLFADDKAPDISKMPYEELAKNGLDYLLAYKFDLSQACFEEMLKRETSKKKTDQEELLAIYYGLGRVFQDKKDIPKSIEYFEKSLSYVNEKSNDIQFLADLYYFAGSAYRISGQYTKALSLDESSVKYAECSYGKQSPRTAVYMMGYALALRDNKENEKALSILKKAYEILEKYHGKNERATQRMAKLLSEWQKGNFEAQLIP